MPARSRTGGQRPSQATWRKTFLRDWRIAADISLERASAEMSLTHGQLSKIERGLHPYNQNVLEVAARLYKTSVQNLLTRAPGDSQTVFGVWDRLSPAQRRRAGRLLDAIALDDD